MIRLDGTIFESTQSGAEMLSYVEVYKVVRSVGGCSCEDFDRFASYNILWCR